MFKTKEKIFNNYNMFACKSDSYDLLLCKDEDKQKKVICEWTANL